MRVLTELVAVMLLGLLAACTIPADVITVHTSSSSANDVINGYRQWTRVNPEPVVFHSRLAIQCAAPTRQQIEMEKDDPHMNKFITVYVNELGTKAMMHEKNPRFPQGSVIVKEKLPSKDSTTPELLTVMFKREAGFNPENGDWEYMVSDGAGQEVHARGRLEKCQSCHTMVKDTDYVYRNYLPNEAWQKLK
jgi:hypothetical protein